MNFCSGVVLHGEAANNPAEPLLQPGELSGLRALLPLPYAGYRYRGIYFVTYCRPGMRIRFCQKKTGPGLCTLNEGRFLKDF